MELLTSKDLYNYITKNKIDYGEIKVVVKEGKLWEVQSMVKHRPR